ncbi:MAG: purine-nucleoside phosphorylase [Desulfovibrionaceae bacterium]
MQEHARIRQAATFIQEKFEEVQAGCTGIVAGTGLGQDPPWDQAPRALDYADIPGFPVSTVRSHAGRLLAGTMAGLPVLMLQGRFHLYEGHSPATACAGVRTLGQLGVKTLVLTNAAGAVNPRFDAGDLMLLDDHINFTGAGPLEGANVDQWGPRFPDMAQVYAPRLAELALRAAAELRIRIERGVYLQVRGPQLETPAETRAFRLLGADAVGMSTALEAMAAAHMSMEVLAVSCLTNKNLPDCMAPVSLEEVIACASKAAGGLWRLVRRVLELSSRGDEV